MKRNGTKKPIYKRWWAIAIAVIMAISVIGGLSGAWGDDSSSSATSSKSSSAASSKVVQKKASSMTKKSESKKQEALASSKSVAESESKSLASARSTNENNNYNNFLTAVSGIPQQTQNAITAATYDENTQTMELVLNDDALSLNDAELKNVVKAAWDAGKNIYEKYSPMPSDKVTLKQVTVKDSSGNELAKSSLFGGFKYEAK
ncbi:hypothetical protein ACJ8L9_06315 [Lacticaseibacillus rhamnosus]|uniref:hypothetical protein n=1 Tax=Lacticaseibacillus rhamnosus TaxID=47715 RepID=UPI003B99FF42